MIIFLKYINDLDIMNESCVYVYPMKFWSSDFGLHNALQNLVYYYYFTFYFFTTYLNILSFSGQYYT